MDYGIGILHFLYRFAEKVRNLRLVCSVQAYKFTFVFPEEIIRRRLMIDGDGTGDARLMMMFMKQFIKWCSTDDTAQER